MDNMCNLAVMSLLKFKKTYLTYNVTSFHKHFQIAHVSICSDRFARTNNKRYENAHPTFSVCPWNERAAV